MKQTNNRICRCCRFFTTYYTRCMVCFYRHKRGYCSLRKTDVATREYCEGFRNRNTQTKKMTTEQIKAAISDAKALKKFLKDT